MRNLCDALVPCSTTASWIDTLKAQSWPFEFHNIDVDRKITTELTPAAKELLFLEGYDRAYGARPLKRAIQREIETPMARRILGGEVRDGQHVSVDVDSSDKLQFQIHSESREAAALKEA